MICCIEIMAAAHPIDSDDKDWMKDPLCTYFSSENEIDSYERIVSVSGKVNNKYL